MIRLLRVSKSFGPLPAVKTMTLEPAARRTTVLIGPSGSGKSTILRMITGLVRPDTGSVCFDGVRMSPENLLGIRRKMGYVIQEGGLFPHLTIRGNVTLMPRYLHWKRAAIQSRLDQLLSLVRLPQEILDRYPAELSGGQNQRVSLMRALVLDPQVLLLDEPLGALDPMVRHDLQNDLKHIFRVLGKTVVMVTHDMGEAGFFGDEIVLLREGAIVQRGTLEELVNHPADPFVETFVNAQRSPLESVDRRLCEPGVR